MKTFTMEQEFHELKKEFHELKKEFSGVKDTLTQIYSLLIGNEHDETTGFLHWKHETERRLTDIEKIIDKAKWFIIGFSAFAGVGIVKVVSFVSNFLR